MDGCRKERKRVNKVCNYFLLCHSISSCGGGDGGGLRFVSGTMPSFGVIGRVGGKTHAVFSSSKSRAASLCVQTGNESIVSESDSDARSRKIDYVLGYSITVYWCF